MAWKLIYQAYDNFERNFLHVSCALGLVLAKGLVAINITFRNTDGSHNH